MMAAPSHAKLLPLITKSEIKAQITKIAKEIHRDYLEKDLVLVMVLKGAICITADLMREIGLPLDLQVVQAKSYDGMERGKLNVLGIDTLNVTGRDVILVDDIYDTGYTLSAVAAQISEKKPASLKTCVHLQKKDVKGQKKVKIDYPLFTIPNSFVVGYGLDYNEQYRELPGIFFLEQP